MEIRWKGNDKCIEYAYLDNNKVRKVKEEKILSLDTIDSFEWKWIDLTRELELSIFISRKIEYEKKRLKTVP